jgi:hypothetical protein
MQVKVRLLWPAVHHDFTVIVALHAILVQRHYPTTIIICINTEFRMGKKSTSLQPGACG